MSSSVAHACSFYSYFNLGYFFSAGIFAYENLTELPKACTA